MDNKILNKILVLLAVFLVLGVSIVFVRNLSNTPVVKPTTKSLPITLRECVSREVGISFACDPSWELSRKNKIIKVTISKIPLVQMVLEESDMKIHFMSEMNDGAFSSTGRYEPGFNVEHLTRCNREVIKVNGYLKGHPQARVSDFYLADHLQLHSVKFTIDPKEAWEDYKWLIKEIVDSVSFINQSFNVKFNLEATDETCADLIEKKTP